MDKEAPLSFSPLCCVLSSYPSIHPLAVLLPAPQSLCDTIKSQPGTSPSLPLSKVLETMLPSLGGPGELDVRDVPSRLRATTHLSVFEMLEALTTSGRDQRVLASVP